MHLTTDHKKHDLNDRKTLKVQISMRHILRLHSLKILTGRTVSEMMEEALEGLDEVA